MRGRSAWESDMDAYLKAYIQSHVHVDAGQRVFCKNQELEIHMVGGVRKVVLPDKVSTQTFTLQDLKDAGARVDVVTKKTLAMHGAEARWADQIVERRKIGLPSNVYLANARSIDYAIEKGRTPPAAKFMGRQRNLMTEYYDTVDEVIQAMADKKWRTEFHRGRFKTPEK